jgi:hypothetical protein
MVENEKPASPPEDDPLLKDLTPRERQLVIGSPGSALRAAAGM